MGISFSRCFAYWYFYAFVGLLWAQGTWESLRLPAPEVYPLYTAESLPPLPVYRLMAPTLKWYMPPLVDSTYKFLKNKQLSTHLVSGFRIQVFSSMKRAQADSIKFYLLETYPDLPVYFLYEAPLYKIRVGDFLDRYAAQQQVEFLRKEFPSAFIVPDKIPKP